MFKRSTKATALLIAAASVISTVPATAATKLGTKDGTIENAVAFGDGKYLYQGYRTDDDDNGLYFNSGDKDKMLDDADEIDEIFGKKYVSVKEGSDLYVVDMESGKITDEDTIEDLRDTAQTKLQNKLRNTDRYENNYDFDTDGNEFDRVQGDKFEETYYSYQIKEADGKNKFGYTTENGKYIDCSYDLNLYAYATSTGQSNGKMYKVEDIDDKVDNGNKYEDGEKEKIEVTSVEFVKYIGQDDKYIYSVIKVGLKNSYSVFSSQRIEEDTKHYYVQKVSKEQGDKEDGAYKPKSTEMFEIAPEKEGAIAMGNGDVETAYNALLEKGDFDGEGRTEYAIVDGNIYVYTEDDTDKLKIYKLALRTSEKLDRYEDGHKDKNSSKLSARVVIKTDDTDHNMNDVEEIKADKEEINARSWAVDVNGAVWIIDNGKIYKNAKCGSWELMYTCDRSLDCIDVYDDNNLIAWDSEGDVYTTVGEGSDAAKEEAEDILGEDKTEDTTATVKTGWDQLADGTWNLYDATGAKVTGWANIGGVWYYMDPTTAVMKTGWVLDNGTWYYCNASGAMQTGWLNDNGTWYYLQSNGAMKTGWLNDNGTWYYLQSNGAMKTGWLQDGANWYYLNANGSMAANTTIDGYRLGADGAWIR